MNPLWFIVIPLALLFAFMVGGRCRRQLSAWQLRRYVARWGVAIVATCMVLMVIAKFASNRPFESREASGLIWMLLLLGCVIYAWRLAERNAAEAAPVTGKGRKSPVFVWQAVMILLPVAIMAAIGFVALLRDRAAVESEARQRAEGFIQQLQETFGRRMAAELSLTEIFCNQWLHQQLSRGRWPEGGSQTSRAAVSTNYLALETEWRTKHPTLEPDDVLPNDAHFDGKGEVWGAAVAAQAPQPPDWFTSLSPEQHPWWIDLRQAIASGNPADAYNQASALLMTDPPEGVKANARFAQLRARSQGLEATRAISKLEELKWEDRQVLSESGLPLGALMFAEMLQHAKKTGPTEGLWRELMRQINSPSFLTPLLLDQTEALVSTNQSLRESVAACRKLWQSRVRMGGIAEVIKQNGDLPNASTTNLWIDYEGGAWFCILRPNEIHTAVSSNDLLLRFTNVVTKADCYPQRLLEDAFGNALGAFKSSLPEYFGYRVEVEGKPLTIRGRQGHPPDQAISPLARGTFHMSQTAWRRGREVESLPSHPQFVLSVHLGDRARLFAAHRQRLFLFGGLICVSALAAGVGVVMARRAFYREQRLNEMKSNFVSSVSHELRAPIASVRLLAESLERGKISGAEKQNEYFRFIGQECRRLSSLIENVLDFSRIEQGRKQYEFEPTNLSALVRETVKLMEPYAAEKEVNLKFADAARPALGLSVTLSPSDGETNGVRGDFELAVDGRAIQQALVNLIDNAIKHSAKDETVTVELNRHQPSTINLSVSDHGCGIPTSEHEKIFERFYRLGSELRRETQGVGIGLSIVQHIVAAHGGRVRVESEVGKGSRFTIELPGKNIPTTD